MKTVIYYFTGTGNSLAVTRDLVQEIGGDVEAIPIMKLLHQETIAVDADIAGVVYPAWLHHIPPMVEEFIRKALIKSTYIFAVCLFAVKPYNSIFNLNSLLEQKGRKLDAGFSIAMGGKYILLKDLTFSEDENSKRFVQEKVKVKEIAKCIKKRESVGIEGQYDESDKDISEKLIYAHRNVYKVVEKFRQTDDCDMCGICVDVCPRDNLKLTQNKLTWGENCDYCLACLHWCPKSAIQNGEITPKSRRHHHPDISISDIIAQK
ncbi:MAG: EFR1 family ferrodoxin [Bacillota bacterium]|nr:EFR1 family ferrodoxin [Bacillota bacterium]